MAYVDTKNVSGPALEFCDELSHSKSFLSACKTIDYPGVGTRRSDRRESSNVRDFHHRDGAVEMRV